MHLNSGMILGVTLLENVIYVYNVFYSLLRFDLFLHWCMDGVQVAPLAAVERETDGSLDRHIRASLAFELAEPIASLAVRLQSRVQESEMRTFEVSGTLSTARRRKPTACS